MPHCRLSTAHDGKAHRIGLPVTGKTILIGLGGTGARVVEAAAMLAAAGVGPKDLSVLLIDSDGAHGNGERTAHLLTRYHRFRHIWTSVAHHIDFEGPDAPDFGRVAVEPLLPLGRWQWSPAPEIASLSAMADGVPPPLLNALFHPNSTEAGRQVQHGLGGRAHLGAALFGALFADAAHPVLPPLREALAEGARVFMVGSAFGGTGVGAIMALIKALRGAERQESSMAAMLIPPYFDYGEEAYALALRAQLAEQALRAAGVPLVSMQAGGLSILPNHGRSGRAQCNPSMPQELDAASHLMAYLMGEEEPAILPSGHLRHLHHLIRFCHFNLYETQARLRAKGGLFSGNWAMAMAGKVDPSQSGEPINLLTDLCRRVLEWAGSVEVMAAGQAAPLGWHILLKTRDAMPVTDAPRQGVQMVHPASLSPAQIAATFDQLITDGGQRPNFANILQRLKRKPPVSPAHKGMGRALVAVHGALKSGGGQ